MVRTLIRIQKTLDILNTYISKYPPISKNIVLTQFLLLFTFQLFLSQTIDITKVNFLGPENSLWNINGLWWTLTWDINGLGWTLTFRYQELTVFLLILELSDLGLHCFLWFLYSTVLWDMGTSCFQPFLQKRTILVTILFASLNNEVIWKWGLC